MAARFDLTAVRKQPVYRLSEKFFGTAPDGTELGFTNAFMIKNGKPFFGISGEFHFSRGTEEQWENKILKMKAAGCNTVSTYVFWNHHEETEGCFRFDGPRNLRRFAGLCKKHGMYLIVRIGPFAHGEVRNGGLPDWLYGKPFEVRCCNEGFLYKVRLFYRAIASQLSGLYFKDAGPVIAAQLDNEYMHSAAPWEMTTGISDEWIPAGSDGDAYLLRLKEIAVEEGIVTPFYTCTAWGGAATPVEEMMPMWGGYAYWPWIFRDQVSEHPATPEYFYREYHNSAVPRTYNFEPVYDPQTMPYACCEIGGGMSVSYQYRFRVDPESVDALANCKLGSGCNFLGYYMFCGGSNPRGEHTPYLNESHCAKISYDYQAPIGEFGQIRPGFYRLKSLHMFLKHFSDQLFSLTTVLPEGTRDTDPADTGILRCAVRTDGKRGFLFLNNYQDHAENRQKTGETIHLETEDRPIVIDRISLAAKESAILPFCMELDGGLHLLYAKAQPLSFCRDGSKTTYYFMVPDGMEAEYVFESGRILKPGPGKLVRNLLHTEERDIEIVTMTREESSRFYELETEGKIRYLWSDDVLYSDGDRIFAESVTDSGITLEPVCCGAGRYTFTIPDFKETEEKRGLLRIDYDGDIGHLFSADGTLLSDNFCNGDVWEAGIQEMGIKPGDVLTLYITSEKRKVRISAVFVTKRIIY